MPSVVLDESEDNSMDSCSHTLRCDGYMCKYVQLRAHAWVGTHMRIPLLPAEGPEALPPQRARVLATNTPSNDRKQSSSEERLV